MARMSSAIPTVAISKTTRGRSKSRLTTTTSTAVPMSAPMSRHEISAIQNGKSQLIIIRANSAAPGRPMLPTAKLITRVLR